jgi:hypothetical protein
VFSLCNTKWKETITKLVCGVREEGNGISPNRMAMKTRRITVKMIGPGTLEARGEHKS